MFEQRATFFAVGGAQSVMSWQAKSLLYSHFSIYPSGLQFIHLEALGSLSEPSEDQKGTPHSFILYLRRLDGLNHVTNCQMPVLSPQLPPRLPHLFQGSIIYALGDHNSHTWGP